MNQNERQIIKEAVSRSRLSSREKAEVYAILMEGEEGTISDVLTGDGVAYSELPSIGEILLKMSWMDRLAAFGMLAEWLIDWMPNLAGSLDGVFGDGKAGWITKSLRMISRVVGAPLIIVSRAIRKIVDDCNALSDEEKQKIEQASKEDASENILKETVVRGHVRRLLKERKI